MKLDTLRSNGHVTKEFSLKSKLLEIKKETHRIENAIKLKSSIKFQQKMLMAIVSGLEYSNKRFDPFSIELDGWSENVFENIEDFNTVFERLYEKYKKRGEMAPELELLLTLAGSAFMFNMSNQLFKTMNGNTFNGQMKSLRESMKSTFNQAQQSKSTENPPPPSQQNTGINFTVPTLQNINTIPGSNVRHMQMETIKQNSMNQTERDITDQDRFSIASSTDSIFDQQQPTALASVVPVSVKRTNKKSTGNRTLVI